MSEAAAPACRLFVVLAREAPVGVILRRGPSRWTNLIRWDTRTDAFESGDWIRGRVYEDRCDLSPDGRLLIYFAANWSKRAEEMRGSGAWTAICEPPSFKALFSWPDNSTWGGGGTFLANDEVRLGYAYESVEQPRGLAKPLKAVPSPRESRPFPLGREAAQLAGWVREGHGIASRRQPRGSAVLRATGDLAPFAWSVVEGGVKRPLGPAPWADWDHRGRLIIARDGRLFEIPVGGGEAAYRELADFNALTPPSRDE